MKFRRGWTVVAGLDGLGDRGHEPKAHECGRSERCKAASGEVVRDAHSARLPEPIQRCYRCEETLPRGLRQTGEFDV
jgi:hypothetical protein